MYCNMGARKQRIYLSPTLIWRLMWWTDLSKSNSGKDHFLTIRNVHRSDKGQYRCVYNNSIGSAIFMAGTLSVHCKYYFCLKLCKLILILYIQTGLFLLPATGGPSITSKPIMLLPPKLHRIRYSSFPTSGHNAKYGVPREINSFEN